MNVFRRVVFDTSTLVGAALRIGSMPHRALAYALSAGELCVSASALAELEKVLLRAKFDRYQTSDVRQEFAAIVRRHASLFHTRRSDLVSVWSTPSGGKPAFERPRHALSHCD